MHHFANIFTSFKRIRYSALYHNPLKQAKNARVFYIFLSLSFPLSKKEIPHQSAWESWLTFDVFFLVLLNSCIFCKTLEITFCKLNVKGRARREKYQRIDSVVKHFLYTWEIHQFPLKLTENPKKIIWLHLPSRNSNYRLIQHKKNAQFTHFCTKIYICGSCHAQKSITVGEKRKLIEIRRVNERTHRTRHIFMSPETKLAEEFWKIIALNFLSVLF